ncbi:tyrosine phosphatase [Histoplasma capsulatum var. duboisii H88]|uniref:diphosphoinositol-polyphosphate diphosphatase n=3 Tax=Ajellomyces capsulatus TaxID=5037 RepID=A0A8A1LF03_AJEC8|nr:tyrosine phosphatase [Histoplasma capsulatum var. duboisii H88]
MAKCTWSAMPAQSSCHKMTDLLSPSTAIEIIKDDKQGENGYLVSGFESGPSRPPTPHGAGLPENFAEVVQGVYRSSFPLPVHLDSIARLNLKTIITLVDEKWSPDYGEFIRKNGIKSHVIPILANKAPQVSTPYETVIEVLKIILNPTNHPVLIHCNKGKHRTGCIIACFRRVQGWSLMAALQEYQKYSTPKSRVLDRIYIEEFDSDSLSDLVEKVGARKWLPTIIPVDNIGKDIVETSHISLNDQFPKAESAPPSHFNASLEELHRINSI